ncbi:hypothetical protein EB001_08005 [bacterium]|nr:hypothetical protein [bacterium]
MLPDTSVIHFPAQKKPFKQKNTEWRKKNIDSAESLIFWRHEGLRKNVRNKQINYNLYSNILDPNDVEIAINPFQLKHLTMPSTMQNYPIANPKIDLLVGESIKRGIEYKVRIINDDAISNKENELKDKFYELIMTEFKKESIDEESLKKKLAAFDKFKNYEYQDLRERTATQILAHLSHKLRLDQKFSKGFKDALLVAEEVYLVDVIVGEPIVERLNPKHVHVVRSGLSPYIEDADIIVIENYLSPGRIIDDYHEDLAPDEIDSIENGTFTGGPNTGGGNIDIGMFKPTNVDPELIDTKVFESGTPYRNTFDAYGNIRVLKVFWKSRRKMLKVTKFDEFGDEVVSLEDENYKINEVMGESSEVLWINEWWEGHKIGGANMKGAANALYKRMRPKPVQFRSMENPSKCSPGIIGTIYQTNDNSAVSLMDRMKPYQYMYNILMYNVELAIAKNHGKIMSLDLARIPENWDLDQWMSIAQSMNLAIYDSFKEGNKGAAKGKLAGGQQLPTPVIDLEMGNTIQLYIEMLSYIKHELGEISGISEARQGQISTEEAVGNVQRKVAQSSHITEYWFAEHEFTRKRVLEALLETAKYAWKDKGNKKVQFVLSDGATEIFNLDGAQFNEIDFDIAITTGVDDNIRNQLKDLAHAGLQNGLLNFSQLMDIMMTEDTASIRRKIEKSEMDKMEQAQKQEEEKINIQREQMQAAQKQLDDTREFELEKQSREFADNDKERELKLVMKQMELESSSEESSKPVDNSEALEKIKLQMAKINSDKEAKAKQHSETVRSNLKKEELAEKKLAIDKSKNAKKP